jgi:hypothetical protein
MGIFHGMRWDVGCPHSVRNVWMEEQTLQAIERQSAISNRHHAALTVPSVAFVHCMLQEKQLDPYLIESAAP